ncbi:MAG: c-type cytochrome [Chloroflexi bacterium]|nr:c-type cytochrome [Chloroflexota bacterium]
MLWFRTGDALDETDIVPLVPDSNPTVTSSTPYERGKALFVAKGCIRCHSHAYAGVTGSTSLAIGPDLTRIGEVPYGGLPNDAQFLREWLKDPASKKPSTAMPTLGLADDEIEDLVAFLLTEEVSGPPTHASLEERSNAPDGR